MTKPLLSICIQTFNRSHYLKDCLEGIAQQLTQRDVLGEKVEVVVADNASTDDTEAVVIEYKQRIPRLIYVRNKTNLGFDGNTNVAVTSANGNYCWYFGDDDLIAPGAIEQVVSLCEQERYSIISTVPAPLDRTNIDKISDVKVEEKDLHTSTDPNTSYQQNYYPSALSLLIFRKDEWLETADFSTHTPGWFYFESILKMAAISKLPTLHISTPLVYTGEDCRWADDGEGLRIFIDCSRFLHKMIDWGYDKERTEQEITDNRRKFIRVLVGAKSRGLPQTKEQLALIRGYVQNLPIYERYLAYFIFLLPSPLFSATRWIKEQIF